MSLGAQLRGADVQWIERWQLDVEHARWNAHGGNISGFGLWALGCGLWVQCYSLKRFL
jgi:hypothetical protein